MRVHSFWESFTAFGRCRGRFRGGWRRSLMRIYLIDDLGKNGEYAGFLNTYRTELPPFDLSIFDHYASLKSAIDVCPPDVVLADMRFDTTPVDKLYGSIEGLANSDAFCGNLASAEAYVRGMQGLLICRALRVVGVRVPIILFASLPPNVAQNVLATLAPFTLIEGLILRDVKKALEGISC